MNAQKLPSNRAFGTLFVIVFSLLAIWRWAVSGWGFGSVFWAGLAALVLITTLLRPDFLTPLNRAWMRLAELLNRIVSPIVLGVMYGVLIIPVGLIMRIAGRDALRLRSDGKASTYWRERSDGTFTPDRFKNQF
jgi:hypothetical protein